MACGLDEEVFDSNLRIEDFFYLGVIQYDSGSPIRALFQFDRQLNPIRRKKQ
jgi:hypothetical protein